MAPVALLLIGTGLTLTLVWIKTRFFDFRAQSPQDYATMGPVFDIREHLRGPLLCEGVIYGPIGRVTSRFVADMDVTWDGNVAIMREDFRYDTGTKQSRQWTLTLGSDGTIKAEAPDVIGLGTGRQSGASVVLNYRIKLSPEAGGHVLDTTDWMYLMENGAIINRSQFRKYGIKVAELVATLRRKPQ